LSGSAFFNLSLVFFGIDGSRDGGAISIFSTVNAAGFCRVSSGRPIYEFRDPHSMQYGNLLNKMEDFQEQHRLQGRLRTKQIYHIGEENALGSRQADWPASPDNWVRDDPPIIPARQPWTGSDCMAGIGLADDKKGIAKQRGAAHSGSPQ
jgi:hypothetical protein